MIERDSEAWKNLPVAEEGHIGKYPNKVSEIARLLKEYSPQRILQIGLNAGHSAVLFLEESDALLYSFDIGRYKSTKKCVDVLEEYFPGRHVYIEGNSKDTLKDFNISVDFCLVDGAHEEDVAYSDICNCDRLLLPGGLLLIDDFESKGVKQACKKFGFKGYKQLSFDKKYENGGGLYQKQ